MNQFVIGSKIFMGDDSLDYLLELPQGKAVVITDPYMVSSGIIETVTSRLGSNHTDFVVFSKIEP
ncbi:MAG: alcohol dehydrogenase, partial [Hungatella sp.]|nr:alcohol dehydrogenase [Hungatella sp.]